MRGNYGIGGGDLQLLPVVKADCLEVEGLAVDGQRAKAARSR